MKTCRKCNELKELSNFSKKASNKDGLQYWCKNCCSKSFKTYYNKDTEKHRTRALDYYNINKEKVNARHKQFKKNNRAYYTAIENKRRASKLNRTPKWVVVEKIKAYYDVCAFFNEVNGYTKYHVDHIIPLQGKLVSGLHVHNNLQVILAKDNMKKGNRL